MIAILGLVILLGAGLIAVAGFESNSGSSHAVGSNFTIVGLHVGGLSLGQLFLYGVVVGVVGMLGLSMLLGTFSGRLASRRSRRALSGSLRETETLRLDHERLVQQLDDERSAHDRAALFTPASTNPPEQSAEMVDQSSKTVGHSPVAASGSGSGSGSGSDARTSLLHRIGHRADTRP